ncbi:protein FAM200A-like [Octopus sinensis]|uniref:Protein FAM200A-like n=1 Tax=Octopus sinensis TaxID=2607531 RepID=A0A6P7U8W3_9MOLL|nr:protein FAM200A-like [Octopus sinensis]
MESVKCIDPDKEHNFEAIPLSRDTIQRRQFHIAEHLNLSLLQKLNSQTTLFSLAIDESNDICDSAQLIIFIRTLSFDFEIHEDFLSMKSLPGNVRGQDIFEIVKQCCLEFKLDMTCLRGICTDGAPAMLGKKQGFVARLTEYVSEEYNNKSVIGVHCIIHQQALCSQMKKFEDTLNEVKQIIIYIRNNALRHRQFRTILSGSEISAEDILYHAQVRWLSQGETACRVLDLRKEISNFYSSKQKECPLDKKIS